DLRKDARPGNGKAAFGPLFLCRNDPQDASKAPAATSNQGVHSSCCASAISNGAVQTATSPADSEVSNSPSSKATTPRHQRTRLASLPRDRSKANAPSSASPGASRDARGTGGRVGDGRGNARAA